MIKKVISIALLFMSTMVFVSGCGSVTDKSTSGDYVVKVNGVDVYKSEFMIYLNEAKINFESIGGVDIWETDFEGTTAEEVAKNSAIKAIELVKVSNQKADELGITLDDSEKETANKEAEIEYKSLGDYASKNDITLEDVEKVMQDKMLYTKVYQNVTSDFEISDADFNAYYDSVKDELMDYYTEYMLRSIYVTGYTKALEVVEKYNNGTSFDQLFDEYEEQEGIANEPEMSYKGDLENYFGLEFDVQVGNISSILEGDDGYYIIKVEDVRSASEDEVIENAREVYTSNKKEQLFNDEYTKWSEDIKVEKNEEVFNSIQVR